MAKNDASIRPDDSSACPNKRGRYRLALRGVCVSSAALIMLLGIQGSILGSNSSWHQLGAGGRNVIDFVVAPDHSGVIYLVADRFGYDSRFFRSDDYGRSWKPLEGPYCCSSRVVYMAIDPLDARVVYAYWNPGGEEGPEALFKSLDGGESWTLLRTGMVLGLWADPRHPGAIYVRDPFGFYQTLDGGDTWDEFFADDSRTIQDLQFDPHDPDTLYAVVSGRILKSTNRGQFWVSITNSLGLDRMGSLIVDPETPGTLYIWNEISISRTTDGGRSWRYQNAFSTEEGRLVRLFCSPTDGSHFYAFFQVGYTYEWAESTDAGKTWTRLDVNLPYQGGWARLAIEAGSPDTLWFGTRFGLFSKAVDDGLWQARNRGLALEEKVLAVVPGHSERLYAESSGVLYRTGDGGSTWYPSALDGTPLAVAPHPTDPMKAWLAVNGSSQLPGYGPQTEILETVDAGITWTRMNEDTEELFRVDELVVDRTDPRILYGAGQNGVYRSDDSGETWNRILEGSDYMSILLQADSDMGEKETLYAWGSHSPLYRSVDHGKNWQRITSDVESVAQLAVDSKNPKNLYAVFEPPNIRRSSDGGDTWQETHFWGGVGAPLHFQDLVADWSQEGVLYGSAITDGLVFSRNGGQTWASFEPDWSIESLPGEMLLTSENRLYVDSTNGSARYIDLPAQLETLFPQIADGEVPGGGQFRTTIQLVNQGPAADAVIRLFDNQGHPLSLALGDGVPASEHHVHLERGQSFSAETPGLRTPSVGYARVSGGPGLAGALVYSFAEHGRMTFQAGVPSAEATRSFAVLADISEKEDNGLALVNTGDSPAEVTFSLLDQDGAIVWERSIGDLLSGEPLQPEQHFARYLTEIFPSLVGTTFSGQVQVESSGLLAPVSLRQIGRPGEESGTDIWSVSMFPPVPTRTSDNETQLRPPCCGFLYQMTFPHIVDGTEGDVRVQTTLRLAGYGDEGVEYIIRFISNDGTPMDLELEGPDVIEFRPDYNGWLCRLGPRGRTTIRTRGTGPIKVGYAVTSDRRLPTGGTAFFSWTQQGTKLFETGVPAAPPLNDFTVLFDSEPGLVETAVALTSTGWLATGVTFRLYDRAGNLVASRTFEDYLPEVPESNPYPPWFYREQRARFIYEIFPEVHEQGICGGIVTVHSDQPLFAVTLRQRDDVRVAFPDDLYLITVFPVIPGRHDY